MAWISDETHRKVVRAHIQDGCAFAGFAVKSAYPEPLFPTGYVRITKNAKTMMKISPSWRYWKNFVVSGVKRPNGKKRTASKKVVEFFKLIVVNGFKHFIMISMVSWGAVRWGCLCKEKESHWAKQQSTSTWIVNYNYTRFVDERDLLTIGDLLIIFFWIY